MNDILWKLNRLRVMTFSEVLFRVLRALATRVERVRLENGWQPVPAQPVGSRSELFGHNAEIIDAWNETFRLDTKQLQRYLHGNICFFGHKDISTGMPVDWHREPVTGIIAPLIYGKQLNYRDDSIVGNVKFLWELGRHQHLVPLAVAYAVSGNVCYRDSVIAQIEDWIDNNPYGMGIHWCSALEASLRLISWSLVHSLLILKDGGEGLFDAFDNEDIIGTSIYQHCYFVRHFLSRHSSANNHLIGEVTGLWVACVVFDLGRTGEQWARFAHRELESETSAQVYDDGVDKEQAFYYHMWVLEYLLFARMVAARDGTAFSTRFDKILELMLLFLKDVSAEGGEPPQVGDADDGFVARFDPGWPLAPYIEMIGAAEAVFCNEAAADSQKAFWYRQIANELLTLPEYKWQREFPMAYEQGGYAVLGRPDCQLLMDAGDLGYLGIAAHGHADALSICLAVDGEWWIVDPGTYAYHSDVRWRNYFRSTCAHNTIEVNGLDQSTIAGAFMWSQKAGAKLDSVCIREGEQFASGSHDGYERFGVGHQREIRFDTGANIVRIVDRIVGGSNMDIAIHFHFAPEVTLNRDEITGNWIASHLNSSRRLVFILNSQWKTDVFKGLDDPVLGWYSPSLEVKVPTNTLRGKAKYSDKFECETKIVIE